MFENLSRYYYNEGLRLVRKDKPQPAVQYLSKAVGYDRDNIEAWNLAGLCHYRLGRYKTAEYCWTLSLNQRLEGNTAGDYLSDLRNTLAETGHYFSQIASFCRDEKYGQAARILEKEICSRFDLSADLLNLLGVLKVLDGNTNGAVKCWRTVLSIDKANADAPRYLKEMENRLSYKLLRWKEKLFQRNDRKEI